MRADEPSLPLPRRGPVAACIPPKPSRDCCAGQPRAYPLLAALNRHQRRALHGQPPVAPSLAPTWDPLCGLRCTPHVRWKRRCRILYEAQRRSWGGARGGAVRCPTGLPHSPQPGPLFCVRPASLRSAAIRPSLRASAASPGRHSAAFMLRLLCSASWYAAACACLLLTRMSRALFAMVSRTGTGTTPWDAHAQVIARSATIACVPSLQVGLEPQVFPRRLRKRTCFHPAWTPNAPRKMAFGAPRDEDRLMCGSPTGDCWGRFRPSRHVWPTPGFSCYRSRGCQPLGRGKSASARICKPSSFVPQKACSSFPLLLRPLGAGRRSPGRLGRNLVDSLQRRQERVRLLRLSSSRSPWLSPYSVRMLARSSADWVHPSRRRT